MNKKLIASGIIFVFLIVGLSGCQDIGIGITNIGDITANPENYIGKEVKIEGKCEFGKISDDKGELAQYRVVI